MRDRYKEVDITVVSSSHHLVSSSFPDRFQNNIKWILNTQNIKVKHFILKGLKNLFAVQHINCLEKAFPFITFTQMYIYFIKSYFIHIKSLFFVLAKCRMKLRRSTTSISIKTERKPRWICKLNSSWFYNEETLVPNLSYSTFILFIRQSFQRN